jgi:hypothetical protein
VLIANETASSTRNASGTPLVASSTLIAKLRPWYQDFDMGAPLPVWTDSKGKIYVIGSVDDLKARIKKRNNYFLVRHGEADNNVMGDMIMTKVDDKCHLTPNGKDEAKSAGALLKDKKIDLIISSPFLRTKETAEIIAKEVGFKDKIIFDDRIIEIQAALFDGGEQSRLSQFMHRLTELSAQETAKSKHFLLEELQLYAESIFPSPPSESAPGRGSDAFMNREQMRG